MKHNPMSKVLSNSLLCLSFLVLTCCASKPTEEIEEYEINAVNAGMDSTCFSDVYDVDIIKLENNKNSIIGLVHKLIVNSKEILIYDTSSVPQVFAFDHSGKYITKIGRYGHAKNEYYDIIDVCSNEKGDSIFFLLHDRIMIYDNNGKYVSSCSIDPKYRWKYIERRCDYGYVCATDYYADNLISLCDNSFNVQRELVDIKNVTVEHGSYVWNPICSSHGKIIFCDFYFTSIYVTDTKTLHTTCYRINTGNTAPIDEVKNGIKEYDEFLDVQFDGECVFGHIIHNKRPIVYKFNIKSKSFIIHGYEDHYPDIETYHDGCYYATENPSFLLSLLKGRPNYMSESTYNALMKALEPYADDMNEMDNLYVLKLKKKTKI